MNLHEYQSQELLAQFGVPVPSGELASSVDEAIAILNETFKKLI